MRFLDNAQAIRRFERETLLVSIRLAVPLSAAASLILLSRRLDPNFSFAHLRSATYFSSTVHCLVCLRTAVRSDRDVVLVRAFDPLRPIATESDEGRSIVAMSHTRPANRFNTQRLGSESLP